MKATEEMPSDPRVTQETRDADKHLYMSVYTVSQERASDIYIYLYKIYNNTYVNKQQPVS